MATKEVLSVFLYLLLRKSLDFQKFINKSAIISDIDGPANVCFVFVVSNY